MAERPRIFDDLAGVAGGAISALSGLRDEAEAVARARIEEMIRKLDLVKRDDLDAAMELAANARAVLSTYWPISDAGESEDLMADFYHSARNGTIGDALRSAQVAILSKPASSHPVFWGAFFIVGDSHKPLVSGAARTQLSLQTADAARP